MIIAPSTTSLSLSSPSSNPLAINKASGVDLTRSYGTLKTDIKTNPDFLSHLSKGKKDDILKADSATYKSPDSTSIAEDVVVSCETFDKRYYIGVDFEMPDKDHVNALQILIADNSDLQIKYTTGTSDDQQVKNFILSPDPNEISQNIIDLAEQGIIAGSGSSLEFIKKLKDIGFVDQEANRGTFFILLDEKPIDESKNILRFSFDQLQYKLQFSLI